MTQSPSVDPPGSQRPPDAHTEEAPAAPTSADQLEVVATGDARVDDALSRLSELAVLPLAEQVDVFADIHSRLAAVLADPDSRGH